MFGDMMDKLQKMQQNVGETKARLENMMVESNVEGLRVKVNGNRRIIEVELPDALLEDKEAIEDLLIVACNKALAQAEILHEKEMAASAKGLLPDLPGFGI